MGLLEEWAESFHKPTIEVYLGEARVFPSAVTVDMPLSGAFATASLRHLSYPSATAGLRVPVRILAGWGGYTAPLFTGMTEDSDQNWYPYSYAASCMGNLKKADILSPTSIPFLEQTDGEIIGELLDLAGITDRSIDDSGMVFGTLQPVWIEEGAGIWSLINELDQITGYKTFDSPDGTVRRRRVTGYAGETAAFDLEEGSHVYALTRPRTARGLHNMVIVQGLQVGGYVPTVIRGDPDPDNPALPPHPWVPDPPRHIPYTLSSDLIEDVTQAETIAIRLMEEVNHIQEEMTVRIAGLPFIVPGVTVAVLSSRVGIEIATPYLVDHVTHEIGGGGFWTTLTLVGGVGATGEPGDVGTDPGDPGGPGYPDPPTPLPEPSFMALMTREGFLPIGAEVADVPEGAPDKVRFYTVNCDALGTYAPGEAPDGLTYAWSNNKNADTGSGRFYATAFTKEEMETDADCSITLQVTGLEGSRSITKTLSATEALVRKLFAIQSGIAIVSPDGGETWEEKESTATLPTMGAGDPLDGTGPDAVGGSREITFSRTKGTLEDVNHCYYRTVPITDGGENFHTPPPGALDTKDCRIWDDGTPYGIGSGRWTIELVSLTEGTLDEACSSTASPSGQQVHYAPFPDNVGSGGRDCYSFAPSGDGWTFGAGDVGVEYVLYKGAKLQPGSLPGSYNPSAGDFANGFDFFTLWNDGNHQSNHTWTVLLRGPAPPSANPAAYSSTPEIAGDGFSIFGTTAGTVDRISLDPDTGAATALEMVDLLDEGDPNLEGALLDGFSLGIEVSACWINEADQDRWTVATYHGHLFRTENGGATWKRIANEMTIALGGGEALAHIAHHGTDDTWIAPLGVEHIVESALNPGEYRIATGQGMIVTYDDWATWAIFPAPADPGPGWQSTQSPFGNYHAYNDDDGTITEEISGTEITLPGGLPAFSLPANHSYLSGEGDLNYTVIMGTHHIRDGVLWVATAGGHFLRKEPDASALTLVGTIPEATSWYYDEVTDLPPPDPMEYEGQLFGLRRGVRDGAMPLTVYIAGTPSVHKTWSGGEARDHAPDGWRKSYGDGWEAEHNQTDADDLPGVVSHIGYSSPEWIV